MQGPIEKRILHKISTSFSPVHVEVVNESHQHSVPVNSETHFKVLVVSARFEGLSRIARQRLVHEVLIEELKTGVHALTQRTLTPAEWEREGAASFVSPPCHGGSKAEEG